MFFNTFSLCYGRGQDPAGAATLSVGAGAFGGQVVHLMVGRPGNAVGGAALRISTRRRVSRARFCNEQPARIVSIAMRL